VSGGRTVEKTRARGCIAPGLTNNLNQKNMSYTLRAKFFCRKVEDNGNSEMAQLGAVYGTDDKDNEENNQFSEATPYGELEMQIDNPSAQGFFEEGEEYYLDISKAPKPEATED